MSRSHKGPGARDGRVARELRIVGGTLRGRKFRFPDGAGVRPTPDRVRETLFNWLAPHVAGARCLDLFAGSGALGLEAASRGAAHVTFVDSNGASVRQLKLLAADWSLANVQIVQGEALEWLAAQATPFDVVFLDPPFDSDLLARSLAQLAARSWVAATGFVYVEHAQREAAPALPPGWSVHRSGKAGEVGYHLYRPPASPGGPQ